MLYMFEMQAIVSVEAESEEEAREAVSESCLNQETDVEYGQVNVYLPFYHDFTLQEVVNG